jgi:phospholipase/carboxylesterase
MQLIHTVFEPHGPGPHPTILALHGRGASALDLLGLAPYVCGGRFLVLCPQGPVQMPIGPGAVGYAWLPPGAPGSPPDMPAILAAREQLHTFLDTALERYPIDQRKLIVLGFSQGGVMAYSLGLGDPQRFAALAALSTWLPPGLLDSLPETAAIQRLPILVQHGSRDELIQVDRARQSVEMLRQLRLPLTYHEYEMGHEISARSLTAVSTWLDEKVFHSIVPAG